MGLFHFRSGLAWLYSVPLGLLAITIPPLGIIGWASPLTGAGVLFPGTGWLGIIAFVCLPGIMIRYPCLGTSAAGMLIVVANVAHRTDPSPPRGWEAVDTVFGRSEFEIPDTIHEFQKAQWLQQRSLNSHGAVVIFPETVIPRWNAATEIFWKPTLNQLVNSGKTIVLGATVRGLASGPVNKIIIRGASGPGSFSQRIPPPISMWRPFTRSAFPLRLASLGTVRLAGERPAFLVCYELLLTWPVLSAMFEHPTILVGVANDYWARGTPIPSAQRAALTAWARLFSLPKLMAVNT